MSAIPACINRPEVRAELFADDGSIPNNDKLPLLAYKQAVRLSGDDPAAIFERVFDENGWPAVWRNGFEPYHHYHSATHEVVGVYSGSASIQFGGENGVEISVEAGDAIVIPAGVGHKCLSKSADFAVVGGYPEGFEVDLRRGRDHERPACLEAIAGVALPTLDPIYGPSGPLHEHWG